MGIDFEMLEEGTIDGALEEVGEDHYRACYYDASKLKR